MAYIIGVDVGGTFTDVSLADNSGNWYSAKADTTPQDQSRGVIEGIRKAAALVNKDLREVLAETDYIVHGTTVATNALLEGKLARTALLTTKGHRHVLHMQEGYKPDRYNLRLRQPVPYVSEDMILAIDERIRPDGTVQRALSEENLKETVSSLQEEGVDSVAICFLHAWKNSEHEERAAEYCERMLPHAYVTRSSYVLPRINEYDRFSTTVVNALTGPIVQNYFTTIADQLQAESFRGKLFVMLSHGGLASVTDAGLLAAGTALSGPAGGLAAAEALAKVLQQNNLITFDMGGTSSDIAIVAAGSANLASRRTLNDYTIALPSLDIETLGAGGGSIAFQNATGLLQVGPRSAGAMPGPACYGNGGREPTVTDANVALGFISPERFLGGAKHLDRASAENAIAELASKLGIDMLDCAQGIRRLASARIADGVRLATVARGVDPRRFSLLGFGGAAGLHACEVARDLEIDKIIIPRQASVLSAWGMLQSNLKFELTRTLLVSLDQVDVGVISTAFTELEKAGTGRFDGASDVRVVRSADMRYGEQIFDISVPLPDAVWRSDDVMAAVIAAFEAEHVRMYNYKIPNQDIVLVNIRVGVLRDIAKEPTQQGSGDAPSGKASAHGVRQVYLGEWMDVEAHDLAGVGTSDRIAGPAIIEGDNTTILVPPGFVATAPNAQWIELDYNPGGSR